MFSNCCGRCLQVCFIEWFRVLDPIPASGLLRRAADMKCPRSLDGTQFFLLNRIRLFRCRSRGYYREKSRSRTDLHAGFRPRVRPLPGGSRPVALNRFLPGWYEGLTARTRRQLFKTLKRVPSATRSVEIAPDLSSSPTGAWSGCLRLSFSPLHAPKAERFSSRQEGLGLSARVRPRLDHPQPGC